MVSLLLLQVHSLGGVLDLLLVVVVTHALPAHLCEGFEFLVVDYCGLSEKIQKQLPSHFYFRIILLHQLLELSENSSLGFYEVLLALSVHNDAFEGPSNPLV